MRNKIGLPNPETIHEPFHEAGKIGKIVWSRRLVASPESDQIWDNEAPVKRQGANVGLPNLDEASQPVDQKQGWSVGVLTAYPAPCLNRPNLHKLLFHISALPKFVVTNLALGLTVVNFVVKTAPLKI